MRVRPEGAPAVYEYSQIAPAVDIYTANSTVSKMWLLRDLFHRLGVDTDELVFHLVPDIESDTGMSDSQDGRVLDFIG